MISMIDLIMKTQFCESLSEVNMKICKECVTPESFPGIIIDNSGVCNRCQNSKKIEASDKNKLKYSKDEIGKLLFKFKKENTNYDVLVPLSGGVDSSFALIELVEKYKLKVLAFHNDHGYESDIATQNVRKLCKKLNIDLVIEQKDYLFMKKLWRHANLSEIYGLNCCFVCGNILYANAIKVADRYNVPLIVNGYSKGQIELVRDKEQGVSWLGNFINEIIDKGDKEFVDEFLEKMKPLQKQVVYDEDINIEKIKENGIITVLPFYMFGIYKTDKEKLRKICINSFDWKQPENTYPARTTNCTMNWLNNYYDIKKFGYGNYHEEYSVLIRNGEMTRNQALLDLEFNPPEGILEKLASNLGIDL